MFGISRHQPEPGSSEPAPRYASEPVVTADAYNRLLDFMRVYGRTQTLSRADKALLGRMQALPVSWKNTLPPVGVFDHAEMTPSRSAPLPIPGTGAMPVLSMGAYGLPGVSPVSSSMASPMASAGTDVSAPDQAPGGQTW
jgi:hypothetical protein